MNESLEFKWPGHGEPAGRRGFTLVELLIVVVILGILAAVVIPQFGKATDDAKLNAMTTDLELVRKQVELYKNQHGGAVPSLAQFANQMTAKTNADGTTAGTPKYGPYLNAIPMNPFTNLNDVGSGGVGSSSWFYDETTGEFRANCHAFHTSF